MQPPVDLLPFAARRAVGDPLGRSSRGTASARPSCARSVEAGRSSASSRRSQSRAGVGGEHAAGAVDHRRDPRRVERLADQLGVRGWSAPAPRCAAGGPARAGRLAVRRTVLDRAPEASSATTSAARSRATCSRARACAGVSVAWSARSTARAVRPRGPAAARRSGAPRRRDVLVRRRGPDLPVDDPSVAELGAGEQRVVGVEQRLVAAPVDRAASRASRRVWPRRGRRRRRRRGTRRSPAWGRRSARASRPSSRTRGAGSATGPGRCPGTRRPARPRSGRAAAPSPPRRSDRRGCRVSRVRRSS